MLLQQFRYGVDAIGCGGGGGGGVVVSLSLKLKVVERATGATAETLPLSSQCLAGPTLRWCGSGTTTSTPYRVDTNQCPRVLALGTSNPVAETACLSSCQPALELLFW